MFPKKAKVYINNVKVGKAIMQIWAKWKQVGEHHLEMQSGKGSSQDYEEGCSSRGHSPLAELQIHIWGRKAVLIEGLLMKFWLLPLSFLVSLFYIKYLAVDEQNKIVNEWGTKKKVSLGTR